MRCSRGFSGDFQLQRIWNMLEVLREEETVDFFFPQRKDIIEIWHADKLSG